MNVDQLCRCSTFSVPPPDGGSSPLIAKLSVSRGRNHERHCEIQPHKPSTLYHEASGQPALLDPQRRLQGGSRTESWQIGLSYS